jgi:hypothetical protein
MLLVASTERDIDELLEWIIQDPHHRDHVDPFFWLTGNGILSYKIVDSLGTTMYVRLEEDNKLMRIHTQFGPEEQVSKIRVIKSLLWALPKMELVGRKFDLEGFVFKSTSSSLIKFMTYKFGFTPMGNDDYSKPFEGSQDVRIK